MRIPEERLQIPLYVNGFDIVQKCDVLGDHRHRQPLDLGHQNTQPHRKRQQRPSQGLGL